jgi:spore photoproduct lyase
VISIATELQNTRKIGLQLFIPELVYFEPAALEYPKGQRIHAWAIQQNLPIQITKSHNRITNSASFYENRKTSD